MNTTTAGLLTGLALGFAGYFGGFAAFVVVAALGLAGLVVGHLAGRETRVSDFVRPHEGREGRGRRESFEGNRATRGPGYGTGYGHTRRVR
ncbi:hypothetical protein ACF07F_06470 [Streptomyces sp. NPDC015237]|uniref:hypothetical protein n=1 Tax=Streptomyces sp. NPDC015237 TaxID=3364949 RepID=UPI0036F4EE65